MVLVGVEWVCHFDGSRCGLHCWCAVDRAACDGFACELADCSLDCVLDVFHGVVCFLCKYCGFDIVMTGVRCRSAHSGSLGRNFGNGSRLRWGWRQ